MSPVLTSSVFLLLLLNSDLAYARQLRKVRRRTNPDCKCGVTDPLDVRIIGGSPTTITDHPWQVLILYEKKQHCGGSIINNKYVLTAGHCVNNFKTDQISVLLGVNDRITSNTGSEKLFSVVKATKHENFLAKETYDLRDIALLKLNGTITFNNYIQPVCLPPQGSNYNDKVGTITGWGKKSFDGYPTRKLQKTLVKVLSETQCLKSKLGKSVAEDTKSMLCAYGKQKDACQGDSGGPLVYESPKGIAYQIGIVSWGEKCGLIDYPGVYTKVSSFHNWIIKNTKDAVYCAIPK